MVNKGIPPYGGTKMSIFRVSFFFASFAVLTSSLGALEGREMVGDLWIVLYFLVIYMYLFSCLGWREEEEEEKKGNEEVRRFDDACM